MPELTPALRAGLSVRYAEPHRSYHDGRHLAEVLAALDVLLADGLGPDGVAGADSDAVRAAAWYHDAVYDPRAAAGANEVASALLAETELAAAGWPDPLVRKVSELVRMTASHQADDLDGQLLADADLAVLGASSQRYARYAADIRREYAHVPAADFARARGAILRGFLSRDRIYTTARARARWEAQARVNLAAEIAALTELAARGEH